VAYNLGVPHVSARIPVVAGLAYIERVRGLPPAFAATLAVEPGNRYFQHAIAVLANGEKVGYVAPEVSVNYYDTVAASAAPLSCPARRASRSDHETSGVEILLDFTALESQPRA
jgi:hypothetical protein